MSWTDPTLSPTGQESLFGFWFFRVLVGVCVFLPRCDIPLDPWVSQPMRQWVYKVVPCRKVEGLRPKI